MKGETVELRRLCLTPCRKFLVMGFVSFKGVSPAVAKGKRHRYSEVVHTCYGNFRHPVSGQFCVLSYQGNLYLASSASMLLQCDNSVGAEKALDS